MKAWELGVDQTIKLHKLKIVELEAIKAGKIDQSDHYYKCQVCDGVFRMVMNNYAKEGYCSDCWKEKGLEVAKEKMTGLIGAVIVDFELDMPFSLHDDKPSIKGLTVEKDGKRHKLEINAEPVYLL